MRHSHHPRNTQAKAGSGSKEKRLRPHSQHLSWRLARRMVVGRRNIRELKARRHPRAASGHVGTRRCLNYATTGQQKSIQEKRKQPSHHGGPAAATCTLGTKASPCAEHHPPRLGSGSIQEKRETKGPEHGGPVRATSKLGNTA